MNNTNFPRFVLLTLIALSSLTVKAQNTKETVILYNTKPVKAEITSDGQVNRIISEEPDFLKGFVLTVQDYGQFLDDKNVVASAEVSDITDSFDRTKYSPIAGELKTVVFEDQTATLSDNALKSLDEIIDRLSGNADTKVVMMTLSRYESALVSKNRLNSIRTYFKLRGIDSDRVLFESLFADIDVNEVKIQFLQ